MPKAYSYPEIIIRATFVFLLRRHIRYGGRMGEQTKNGQAIRFFLLKALNEKCRRDRRLSGYCRFGTWDNIQGRRCIIPDIFFADWVNRLTYAIFKEYFESLSSEGLIEVIPKSNREVYFEITEKGRSFMLRGKRSAMPAG